MSNKLETLTWIRGFAAFFVIVNHAILTAKTLYTPQDEASYLAHFDFLNNGLFAVYLFFALSGCTLTLSHGNKINTLADFVPFYIKRFFRIWPAFAVSMIVYLVFIELFKIFYVFDRSAWVAEFLNEYEFIDVLQYLSLTFNIHGTQHLFNGPYWSLPVEFQYYLLLPIALLFMKNKWTTYLVPLFFSAALYLIYYKKIIHIDRIEVFKMGFSFFGGVIVAKAYTVITFKIPLWVAATIFFITSLFMSLLANKFVNLPEAIPIFNDASNVFGVFSIAMVGLALITRPIEHPGRVLNFLSFYGEISYSTYLFHMIFIGVAALIINYAGLYNYMGKFYFTLIFTLVSSYFFAMATYSYIEKPAIKWGAKITQKRI